MKKLNLFYALTILVLLLHACSDDAEDPDLPLGDYENGYFVANEGPFQNGSGTITFVDDDGTVAQNIYKTVNGEDLGNIVNSMYIAGDKAYIVVNNSNKVVVVNKYTMEKIAVIEGQDIINPRFFIALDGKGYISNWGDPFNTDDDFIAVINMESNTVIEKISVGEGPEKMVIEDNNLYVCLQGGYGSNNKVVVIDRSTDTVSENLVVGDVPNSIVLDSKGDVWVLCGGNAAWTGNETPGFLYKINTASNETTFKEFATVDHPSLLNSDMGNLYYTLNGEVFKMDEDDTQLPSGSIAGLDGFYYSMHAENGELFTTDAGDYASEGTLKVYNIASGELLQSITTGIVPGQVVFP